jgi:hypothetical protein
MLTLIELIGLEAVVPECGVYRSLGDRLSSAEQAEISSEFVAGGQ